MKQPDLNLFETRKCSACKREYIPTDEFTSYEHCPPCRATIAFKNVRKKLDSDWFKSTLRENSQYILEYIRRRKDV